MRQYPTEGSLAARLLDSTQEEVTALYGPPQSTPSGPLPNGAERMPAEAAFGNTTWWLEDQGVLATLRFPPLEAHAATLVLYFVVGPRQLLEDVLAHLGLPQPDMDPTHVLGADAAGYRTTSYLPGPPGVAGLMYSTKRAESGVEVLVTARRPAALAAAREELQRIYDQEGTVYSENVAEVQARRGWHYPSGDEEIRQLVIA